MHASWVLALFISIEGTWIEMRTFFRVWSAEWLKLSRSRIWPQMMLSAVIALLLGVVEKQEGPDAIAWQQLLGTMTMLHALLFLPLLTGIFSAMVCRFEHAGGGWKQLLVLPMSRGILYTAKFAVVCTMIMIVQLLFMAAVLLAGWFHGFGFGQLPWLMLGKSLLWGFIACLPLAALQLGVSTAWSSFAAPLALNVVFTIPNMLIVNSATYGPFYPWAQPLLAMLPRGEADFGALNLPIETIMYVIAGGFLLFFMAGFVYFQRKEV